MVTVAVTPITLRFPLFIQSFVRSFVRSSSFPFAIVFDSQDGITNDNNETKVNGSCMRCKPELKMTMCYKNLLSPLLGFILEVQFGECSLQKYHLFTAHLSCINVTMFHTNKFYNFIRVLLRLLSFF